MKTLATNKIAQGLARNSLAAAALVGCAQKPFTEGAQVGIRVNDALAPNARIQYDQVVIIDRAIQSDKGSKIAVESQGTRRTATGALNVIAQLRNRTDHTQNLELRTHFFDAGYVASEAPTAWTRVHVPGNSIATYQESSIGTNSAMHYLVEVREMR